MRRAAPQVAQQVVNGSGCAESHHLIAEPEQCTRERGLAQPEPFLQVAGGGGATAQRKADGVEVQSQGEDRRMNGLMNRFVNGF